MDANTKKKRMATRLLVFVPSILLCLLGILIAVHLFSFGYVAAALHGPKTALSLASPDGVHVAYVTDGPSIDPPNQFLFVERAAKTQFMWIADLAEDVDCIERIVWSPDGDIVVFHSRHYLPSTRVSDWTTMRIYLGKEWRRAQPRRHRTTFSSGGVRPEISQIEFPASGEFAYRLAGDDTLHRGRMDSLVGP